MKSSQGFMVRIFTLTFYSVAGWGRTVTQAYSSSMTNLCWGSENDPPPKIWHFDLLFDLKQAVSETSPPSLPLFSFP